MWVVVNQHIPILMQALHGSQDMAATEHPSVKPFFNMLLSEKVGDLILAAHDHNYQRTKQIGGSLQLFCFNVYTPYLRCRDSNTTYQAGAGSIVIITGSAGGE